MLKLVVCTSAPFPDTLGSFSVPPNSGWEDKAMPDEVPNGPGGFVLTNVTCLDEGNGLELNGPEPDELK